MKRRTKSIILKEEDVEAILHEQKRTFRVLVPYIHSAGPVLYDPLMPLPERQKRYVEQALEKKYRAGDTLYVKETWQQVYDTECDDNAVNGYVNIREWILNFDGIQKKAVGMSNECSTAAMPARMKYYVYKAGNTFHYKDPSNGLVWRSPVCMPKEASRLSLQVMHTEVRRLLDLTTLEAHMEGQPACIGLSACGGGCKTCEADYDNALKWFARHWDLNLKPGQMQHYSTKADPFVGVVTFETLKI